MGIFIAEAVGSPMAPVERVRAVAGRGLAGGHCFAGTGFSSWSAGPVREVSPIEGEAIEAPRHDHGLDLEPTPGVHRRTIVTRGLPLGHLVGGEVAGGGVRLRGGVAIGEPCTPLVDATGIRRIRSPMIHRGGPHAQIPEDGTIVRGDPIEERTEV